jgi:LmbE family N-acetylglucosaminyl deacetylase
VNIVCLGAHPDDGEVYAGGTLIKWAAAGHNVTVVSLTNGDIGHHEMCGEPLAARRAAEAQRAAALGGYTALNLGVHDGALQPTLELRHDVVKLLRTCQADVVLTHRPYDYHPDHRYTSMTVQDAAYMVCVPHFCPGTPALRRNPVFVYMMDHFTRPCPFRPDVAVDVGAVMAQRYAVLDAMDSQFYEWLPWMDGIHESVPAGAAERRRWLEQTWDSFFRVPATRAGEALRARYGGNAAEVIYAELFEVCEYGRQPDPDELARLFPR